MQNQCVISHVAFCASLVHQLIKHPRYGEHRTYRRQVYRGTLAQPPPLDAIWKKRCDLATRLWSYSLRLIWVSILPTGKKRPDLPRKGLDLSEKGNFSPSFYSTGWWPKNLTWLSATSWFWVMDWAHPFLTDSSSWSEPSSERKGSRAKKLSHSWYIRPSR